MAGKFTLMAACLVVLAGASSATAQWTWGGPSDRIITVPIDPSKNSVIEQSQPRPRGPAIFNWRNFYPKISLGAWPPRLFQPAESTTSFGKTDIVSTMSIWDFKQK